MQIFILNSSNLPLHSKTQNQTNLIITATEIERIPQKPVSQTNKIRMHQHLTKSIRVIRVQKKITTKNRQNTFFCNCLSSPSKYGLSANKIVYY
jgi:hypothetical protein